MKELEQPAKISPSSAINSSWVGGGRWIPPPPAAVTSKSKKKTNIQNTANLWNSCVDEIFLLSFPLPGRLPHQHGPVQLALDVSVVGAAGVHEGMHGHQHKALSVEVSHLDGELPHGGQAQHGGHRGHLCSGGVERSEVRDG